MCGVPNDARFRRVLGRGVEVVQPNSPCSSLDRISSTQYSGKTAPDPVSILALALHPRALRLPIVHFFVPPLRRRTRESKSRQSRSAVAPRAPFLWAENLGRFFTIGIKIYRIPIVAAAYILDALLMSLAVVACRVLTRGKSFCEDPCRVNRSVVGNQ